MWLFISALGVFLVCCFGFSLTGVQGGVIWGINVPLSEKQKSFRTVSIILVIVGIILSVIAAVPVFLTILGTFLRTFFSYMILILVAIIAGVFLGQKLSMDLAKNSNNALILKRNPIIRSVDQKIPYSVGFVIAPEGISFADANNYCFATELFKDYRFGDLGKKELAIFSLYFEQKYRDQFAFKADWARTFYPGQQVTFIGVGGIYTGHTGLTMDSHLKGYLFWRTSGAALPLNFNASANNSALQNTASENTFCSKCGTKLASDTAFCPKCGNPLH